MEVRLMYAVAERLHKTIPEIESMNEIEFHGWVEYLGILSDGKRKG